MNHIYKKIISSTLILILFSSCKYNSPKIKHDERSSNNTEISDNIPVRKTKDTSPQITPNEIVISDTDTINHKQSKSAEFENNDIISNDKRYKNDLDRYSKYRSRVESQKMVNNVVTTQPSVKTFLNVRNAPDVNSDAISQLHPGELASLTSIENGWVGINMNDGTKGFVSSKYSNIKTKSRDLEIHFVNVGQGDSSVILCPNGKNILIDGGESSSNVNEDDITDYIFELLDPYNPKIDTLIITHPDSDHYNLLPKILKNIPIGHIFHSDINFRQYRDANFNKWLKNKPGEKRTRLDEKYFDKPNEPNDKIDCGDAKIYILAAGIESTFSMKNTRSIVFMVEYGEFKAILTGDATKITEEVIMSRYPQKWLDVDLLKLGHHGSGYTSTYPNWADITKPRIAIASSGWDNRYGHPKSEVINNIIPYINKSPPHHFRWASGSVNHYNWHHNGSYSKAIFNTATNGNIIIISDGSDDYEVTWFHYEH